ncbi:hypothetical protein AVEN_168654-1 [Araneus ventricosus]|uniref:Uncharacterized protein n=1 Tax=Araneus ventricosus TaxID=182803 RepID=A0A4Y2PJQ0_ARAVE|nr:hypothetical protein AVEN_168654-1 [Araneus ventricosus]
MAEKEQSPSGKVDVGGKGFRSIFFQFSGRRGRRKTVCLVGISLPLRIKGINLLGLAEILLRVGVSDQWKRSAQKTVLVLRSGVDV